MMSSKQLTRLWGVSLMVLGLAGAAMVLTQFLGPVPDAVTRLLGAALLVALPVFSYASIRRWREEKKR